MVRRALSSCAHNNIYTVTGILNISSALLLVPARESVSLAGDPVNVVIVQTAGQAAVCVTAHLVRESKRRQVVSSLYYSLW
jgi:hypothetical protein